jgi:hypothetical protein
MTITVTPAGVTSERVVIENEATASTSSRNGERPRIPLTMPREQTYYWSAVWQRAEAESLADYAAGDFFESHDPNDVIRWLDEPDEG